MFFFSRLFVWKCIIGCIEACAMCRVPCAVCFMQIPARKYFKIEQRYLWRTLIKKMLTLFCVQVIATATAIDTDAGCRWSAFETDEIPYHVDAKWYQFDSCESNCLYRFRYVWTTLFFSLLSAHLFLFYLLHARYRGHKNNLDYVANRQKIERRQNKAYERRYQRHDTRYKMQKRP